MYKFGRKSASHLRFWLLIGLGVLALAVGTVAVLRGWYNYNLQPASSSAATQYFTVESGSSLNEIAVKLQRAGLIKSSSAFKTYVRSHELHNDLQVGTYSLSPSMSVQEIVKKLTEGDVAKNLLTILPGKRLDEIKSKFSEAGYDQAEIDNAFNPFTYRGHPALDSLPSGASLEGYLYPESFQKLDNTPAETIVRQSLDEMNKSLTDDIKKGFADRGLNIYQGITLSSIILQELNDTAGTEDQLKISQVLHLRLQKGMLLQTDPTVEYAAAIAGVKKDYNIDSPYNTYKYPGLPPSPIGNVTKNALKAAAFPEKTDYLYFFTADDCKFYYSHTLEEHQKGVRERLKEGCKQ